MPRLAFMLLMEFAMLLPESVLPPPAALVCPPPVFEPSPPNWARACVGERIETLAATENVARQPTRTRKDAARIVIFMGRSLSDIAQDDFLIGIFLNLRSVVISAACGK